MRCNKFGHDLEDDSVFCENCGSKVNGASISGIDLTDLAPDSLDDLMPKKKHYFVICFVIFLVLVVCIFVCFSLMHKTTKKEKTKIDYQTIIDEYGKAVEKSASDYLLEHELIDSFDDIASSVKYDKHKVNCDDIIINIDGTVYLADCSIDGNKVEETYGRRKKISTKDDECNIIHNNDENQLEFYVDSELVSIYECEHDKCDLEEQTNYNSCGDKIAVIEDGDDKILYNYQAVQNLLDPFSEVVAVKDQDKVLGFIFKDAKTEKYGYTDTRGTIKLEAKYDHLGLIDNGKLYRRSFDLDKSKITASLDNKYGVIDLNTGKELMPFKYDNIYLGSNDSYVVKEGNIYYLVNSDQTRIFDKGYSMIFAFDKILVVNENQKLKIIDLQGNKLIDKELNTYIDYKDEPVSGIFGYNVTKVDEGLLIEINKANDDGYDTESYIYNIESKSLEAKNN